MRGYYIINTDIKNKKGHTLNIFKTIESMRSHGLDIVLVCPRYHATYDEDALFRAYTVQQPFPIRTLWTPFRRAGRLAFAWFTVLTALWLYKERIVNTYRFVYFRSEHFYVLTFLLMVIRIPYFYEVHRVGLTAGEQRRKVSIARRAAGITVLTNGLRDQFKEANPSICLAPDAVDYTHYDIAVTKKEARMRCGIPLDATVVMYTGSVQKEKGIGLLVAAARAAPEHTFYIVGRVSEDVRDVLADTPEHVVIAGTYTQEEAPYYVKAADVLVLPHPEGVRFQSPMKLFEYMASGRPIICADLPHLREVLPPENLFFQPEDPGALSAAISRYFMRPEAYAHIVEKNQQVAQQHTYKKRGRTIASFIAQTLSES